MSKSKTKLSYPVDRLSIITSKLKKHREKKGLYIIALNSSKYLPSDEFDQMKKTAYNLSKYLLKDPQSWVGVMALSDEFKYFNRDKFSQKMDIISKQIQGISQQMTQPVTVLNTFIKNWKKENKIIKTFDVFVVVLSSSSSFNPDTKFYKLFTDKKLNIFPILYGTQFLISGENAIQFATFKELHNKVDSLITRTDSLMSQVEFFPENNAVAIKFITNHQNPEFELHIFRVVGDQHFLVNDPIFTNKKEIRVDNLEPDSKYILKYRFNFSDGLNSSFFEEVSFHTLSQSPKDLGIMAYDQVKSEHINIKQNIMCLQVSPIEKLMGVHSYNILLFGRIGAGKSSWASTINRSATGVFNPNFAYVDFSYKSCTQELNKLELFDCSPIKLWDTYGLDDKNYDNSILENILDGKVKDLFKPGESVSNKTGRLNDMVHAVLIVVDIQIFPDEDELEKLRRKVDKIKQKKYYPIMLITKMDTLSGKNDFPISCQTMYGHKQSQEILQRAHQIFRIDKNNIFFMINYRGEEPQDIYKEVLAMRILKRCIERSKQFISQRKKILVKSANGGAQKVFPLARDDISLEEFRSLYGVQIAKMIKANDASDFIFIEYMDDEEDTFLNEIDQIDEELGERIKYITVSQRPQVPIRRPNYLKAPHSQLDMDSSINDRDSAAPSKRKNFPDLSDNVDKFNDIQTVHSSSLRGDHYYFSEESKDTIIQKATKMGSNNHGEGNTTNKKPQMYDQGEEYPDSSTPKRNQQWSFNDREEEEDDDEDYPLDFEQGEDYKADAGDKDKVLDYCFEDNNQSPIPSNDKVSQYEKDPSEIEYLQNTLSDQNPGTAKWSQPIKQTSQEETPKARLVINGVEQQEYVQLNGSLSLYSVRQHLEETGSFKQKSFSFVRKLNGQDYLIPGKYANESAIKFEKVVDKKENEYQINIKTYN